MQKQGVVVGDVGGRTILESTQSLEADPRDDCGCRIPVPDVLPLDVRSFTVLPRATCRISPQDD